MNILVFICDTLRADHLGCYGYFRDTSPNIDRLARDGTLFEQCYASGVCTGVSFTSIHTGLYPIHHQVYDVCPPTLILDDIPTLAELLRANGYTTVAFDNLAYNRAWCQDPVHFYRGFEHYITDVSNPRDWDALGETVMAEWYTQRLTDWISAHRQERFFAFVHLWDVHQPYVLPPLYRERFHHRIGDRSDLEVREARAGYQYVPGWGQVGHIYEGRGTIPEKRSPLSVPRREACIDLYDGAIAYLDHCLGGVVAWLESERLLDDTFILVTADHGELLGQHGIYTHDNVWDANIHVPLIMRHPTRLPAGRRVTGLAGTIDILPTLLELAGNRITPAVDGISLVPLLTGREHREYIVSEAGGGIRGIVQDEWKLMLDYRENPVELYNLASDPMEVINLADENGPRAQDLRRLLAQWAADNLRAGEPDPVLEVARTYDRAKLLERISINNYVPTAAVA
jgi:arylsulfatase A-like enzyme